MIKTNVSVRSSTTDGFEHLCCEYGIWYMKRFTFVDKAIYTLQGSPDDIFFVGMAVGIQMGEDDLMTELNELKEN